MRQCQLVLDLLDGTCKICKLLSFFDSWAILRVLLVAGTSSEGDGTTRRFRGYFNGGVLSRAGWGCFVCVFLLLLQFSVPAGSSTLNHTFRIFHRSFVIFVRRLLDVTGGLKEVKKMSVTVSNQRLVRYSLKHPRPRDVFNRPRAIHPFLQVTSVNALSDLSLPAITTLELTSGNV